MAASWEERLQRGDDELWVYYWPDSSVGLEGFTVLYNDINDDVDIGDVGNVYKGEMIFISSNGHICNHPRCPKLRKGSRFCPNK